MTSRDPCPYGQQGCPGGAACTCALPPQASKEQFTCNVHGPGACICLGARYWMDRAQAAERSRVETPREHPALAAADVLAHQYIFTPFHEAYWKARGGHGACTVCNPPPVKTSRDEADSLEAFSNHANPEGT